MKHDLDYMISVMQAAKEGKEIEYYNHSEDKWYDCKCLDWNWGVCDYRVKPEEPESKYVPYENVEEFIQGMNEHGPMVRIGKRQETMWSIRHPYTYYSICYANSEGVKLNYFLIGPFGGDMPIITYADMRYDWTWQDGTPCGKLKE